MCLVGWFIVVRCLFKGVEYIWGSVSLYCTWNGKIVVVFAPTEICFLCVKH
jgi:hypothetical protein